jgi:hypothetical protein
MSQYKGFQIKVYLTTGGYLADFFDPRQPGLFEKNGQRFTIDRAAPTIEGARRAAIKKIRDIYRKRHHPAVR